MAARVLRFGARRVAGLAAFGAASAALSSRQSCGCTSTPAPAPAQPPGAPPSSAPTAPPPEPSLLDKALAPVKGAYDTVMGAVYDNVIKPYAEPSRDRLLPDLPPNVAPKPTLVISLDGLLIESVYTRQHGWRYVKRPGVDTFLEQLYPFYEIVLWTDCLQNADPIIDKFDVRRRIRHRLYRDTTTYRNGVHCKDLSVLNRELHKVIILDTDKEAYALHPGHGIVVPKYDHTCDPDKADDALTKLIPFLQYLAIAGVPDLSAEIAKVAGQDIGAAFEQKLAELRASGKLRLPRGRVAGAEDPHRGPTVWDRLRTRKD